MEITISLDSNQPPEAQAEYLAILKSLQEFCYVVHESDLLKHEVYNFKLTLRKKYRCCQA